MTSTQTPEVNLLDTVVFDLLADGWAHLGRSYNGVAVEHDGLAVELRPDHDGGLGVATLTNGFFFLGHAHTTQAVTDLVALRCELRRDVIRRQANIDRGVGEGGWR